MGIGQKSTILLIMIGLNYIFSMSFILIIYVYNYIILADAALRIVNLSF